MSSEPVVLVTGAGKGLGRAICERFHAEGYAAVATDIDAGLLSDLDGRERFVPLELNVTDTDQANAVAEQVARQCGRLDVLVNCAGIIGFFPLSEMPPDELIQHFQINTFGALRLTHACLDLLVRTKGRVVNISSESFRLRTPFQAYQPTKLALEGISDVLRRELVHLGVHVATVRPGAIETDLFHAMDMIDNPVADSRLTDPFNKFATTLSENPPKKRSQPEEVAGLVFHAATDRKKRPHYQINNMLALKVASLLPDALTDRILRRKLS